MRNTGKKHMEENSDISTAYVQIGWISAIPAGNESMTLCYLPFTKLWNIF